MTFLAKILRGIAFIPAIVQGIEGLFGTKSGDQKKGAAMSFVSAALSLTEAIANKDIVDNNAFTDGIGKIIDGTVQCLNASVWAKSKN